MATTLNHCTHEETSNGSCETIPDLERLCYFFGQLLEPADFRAEQRYFATLLSLLGRYTAGWGVVCGLDVKVESHASPECADDYDKSARFLLTVTEGIAIDCCGRLIVLRERFRCDLHRLIGKAEWEQLRNGKSLYVSIEHVDRPVRPTRGLAETCDPMMSVQYGRIRDEARVVVTLEKPNQSDCDTCIDACLDSRVLLASLQLDDPAAHPVVVPDVRRMLARHELATITGVGWVHGGAYERRHAERLLAHGFGLRFSRPILVQCLEEGVIDLIIYEGGAGRRDALYFKAVDLEWKSGETAVSEVLVKVSQPEGFQIGDRIHLSVRCDFLLDECCRAVSGAHLGGGVPFDRTLARSEVKHPAARELPCPHPPDRSGLWRSGNGVEGGVWDSWIKVIDNEYPKPTGDNAA